MGWGGWFCPSTRDEHKTGSNTPPHSRFTIIAPSGAFSQSVHPPPVGVDFWGSCHVRDRVALRGVERVGPDALDSVTSVYFACPRPQLPKSAKKNARTRAFLMSLCWGYMVDDRITKSTDFRKIMKILKIRQKINVNPLHITTRGRPQPCQAGF